MGLVYFYKTDCCMLGADVAVLLTADKLTAWPLPSCNCWARTSLCNAGLSSAEKPGIGEMAGTCQVDLRAAPSARACFGRNLLSTCPQCPSALSSSEDLREWAEVGRGGENMWCTCADVSWLRGKADLSPLVPNTTIQPMPGMAKFICHSENECA